ncbi:MAG: glycosyltransferase family 39 protein [Candidatus Gottesmanbacteria bacterium]|nr:glycosyltransferase family 39 protein [Candidatus Gottesmanbacteria bacterium]
MNWTSVKRYIPLLCIVILASLFRFVYLNRIPNAISGDELLYAITAKSIYLTGHDISGTWNPLSVFLFRYPPNEQQAELPYFLHLLTAPFPFSLYLAKLPFAIFSVGIVILLYLIAKKLFGESVGIATGLTAAINPWLVVMGRTGYESTPATFFYLLGLYLMLTTHGWSIVWSILPFILAFYSYIGTKLIFIPFVAVTAFLAYLRRKQYKKQFILVCLISLAFTVGFLILLKSSPTGSRISELFLPNSTTVSNDVNEIRRTAIQLPFLSLAVNKYTVYFQEVFTKIFRIFSPTYLFVEGDQFFLPARQSFFYYIDFFFLALGALVVFTKKRIYFFVIWIFILLGTFPHLFHKTTGDFSGHLTLMFPFMVILIGSGIAGLIRSVTNRYKPFIIIGIICLYAVNLVSFSVIYFAQTPLVGYADFPMRVLSRYAKMGARQSKPVIIYSTRSYDVFKKYLFYTDMMNKQTIPEIRRIGNQSLFVFDGIHFSSCPNTVTTATESTTLIYDVGCNPPENLPHLSITKLSDAGETYKIFNDTMCQPYELQRYPQHLTFSDFSIESLTEKEFCTVYISRR